MKRMWIAALALIVVAAPPAFSDRVIRRDSNEPDIKVDIKTVLYGHRDDLTVLRTKTFEELRLRHLRDGLVTWILDTKGDAAPDFYINMSYNFFRKRLFCEVRKISNFRRVGRGETNRGADFVTCKFKRDLVDGVAEHFAASAAYGGDNDDAPNMFMYRH